MRGHVITSPDPREAFHRVAEKLALTPVKTLPEEGFRPYQETWCDTHKAAFVQYVELPVMKIAYFIVTGDTGDATAQVHMFAGLYLELDYASRDQTLSEPRRGNRGRTDPGPYALEHVAIDHRLREVEVDP